MASRGDEAGLEGGEQGGFQERREEVKAESKQRSGGGASFGCWKDGTLGRETQNRHGERDREREREGDILPTRLVGRLAGRLKSHGSVARAVPQLAARARERGSGTMSLDACCCARLQRKQEKRKQKKRGACGREKETMGARDSLLRMHEAWTPAEPTAEQLLRASSKQASKH